MITQKDIAKRLGVSVSLVSRVLAGKAREIGVIEPTIRRIEVAAENMGYVPSAAARTLRGASSRTLGVVVSDFADPFFAPMLEELQSQARLHDFTTVLVGFEHRRVKERDIRPLLKHALDFVLVMGSLSRLEWTRPFVRRGVPVVRLGGGTAPTGVQSVGVDDAAGVAAVMEHLQSLGHRRVGFLGLAGGVHANRLACFRATARRLGMAIRPAWMVTLRTDRTDAGGGACRRLLASARGRLPSALVCSSDVIALGAIRVLAEHGIRVPQDISVTGFDDIPPAHWSVPALTTARQPVSEMVRRAFAIARGGEAAAAAVRLVPQLVVRESTGRAV
jgi:DNA-binding LacI/PurR family transcriptional regulator